MATAPPKYFLAGQRLSRLTATDPAEVMARVCEVDRLRPTDRRQDDDRAWEDVPRPDVVALAGGSAPAPRVGLVCGAGLGKTTTMRWLERELCTGKGWTHLPLLLRLDDGRDLDRLMTAGDNPDVLAERLELLVANANSRPVGTYTDTVRRLHHRGRVILLLDGLDHALARKHVPQMLGELLTATAWKGCPVWVAGRPHAFRDAWGEVFAAGGWQFLRVEPLAEAERRRFFVLHAGADHHDRFPPESWPLLAVPRLLSLVCGIVRGAVAEARAAGRDPGTAVERLGLRTPADVYSLAYFRLGDPARPDTQGLLAQGLTGAAAGAGLPDGGKPTVTGLPRQVGRLGDLLGAIAVQMLALEIDAPEPNTSGVRLADLEPGTADRPGLLDRLTAAGWGGLTDFDRACDHLRGMNARHLEFLLFDDLSADQCRFHDRTVLAFFAAVWVMTHGTPRDRALMRRWVVDDGGVGRTGFHEFWQFAAELPDTRLKPDVWRAAFEPCYAPPRELTRDLGHDRVQWHRRMVYLSFPAMLVRFPGVVDGWMAPAEERASIQAGLVDIPAGDCQYGADPVEKQHGVAIRVEAFRLHHHPVTNVQYEKFDPSHEAVRWADRNLDPQPHLLGETVTAGCPVVYVTWYDAWNFAAWCGCRLPTEQEWEHACRAGSKTRYSFGDEDDRLPDHAWFDANSGDSTHPVGERPIPNCKHLYSLSDMHGNVWEWCDNLWGATGSVRVVRGGCWASSAGRCPSAFRGRYGPYLPSYDLGFRLAGVPSGQTSRPG